MRNGADPGWVLGWVGGKGEANRAWWLWRGDPERSGLVKSAPEPKRKQECGVGRRGNPKWDSVDRTGQPRGEEEQKGGDRS